MKTKRAKTTKTAVIEVPEIANEEEILTAKMNRDLRGKAATMSRNQARTLVSAYYATQDKRMREAHQIRGTEKHNEPHDVLDWFKENSENIEKQVAAAIKVYAEHDEMAKWSMQTKGIGPIIAACLSAFIDIEKCDTVGAIWRFAGLDPTCEWKKGEKRPWNATLKTCCWKIGESFVKVSGDPQAFYAQIYLQRKAYEQAKNEAGDYAGQAAAKLAKFKIGKDTDAYAAYSKGKLPPGHIHARAKRYAVKLFLSHWFEEAYRRHHGKEPPLPYPIGILGHAHQIKAA